MLKLISLNIERSRHLDRIIPFFQKEKPDVLCLQEVLEADLEKIKEVVDLPFGVWLEIIYADDPENSTGAPGYAGMVILSKEPFLEKGSEYYYQPEGGIKVQDMRRPRETNAQGLVWARLKHAGSEYVIVNTHFTWTPDGHANDAQREDFPVLQNILEGIGPHVLVGDLNAPRGRETWEKFAALYQSDNIPVDVTSTVDPLLHRTKGLEHVVDCLFTSEPYLAEDVRIVDGVSDHKAVVAHISRQGA